MYGKEIWSTENENENEINDIFSFIVLLKLLPLVVIIDTK